MLIEQLVEVELLLGETVHLLPDFGRRHVQVGGIARQMAAVLRAAHRLVEPLAAVATRHAEHTEAPSERFQHLFAELPQVFHRFGWRFVRQSQADGHAASCEFTQSEVFRQPYFFILFLFHDTVIIKGSGAKVRKAAAEKKQHLYHDVYNTHPFPFTARLSSRDFHRARQLSESGRRPAGTVAPR